MFNSEKVKSCLICNRASDNIKLIYEKQNLLIVCPYCGMYILPENWRGYSYISGMNSKLKSKLKFNLKINEKEYSKSITVNQFQQENLKSGDINLKMPKNFSQYQIRVVFGYKPPKFSNEQDILNYINTRKDYPESTNEKLDNLLIYLYNNGGTEGQHISILEEDYSILCIENSTILQRFAVNLKEKKFLEAILSENGLNSACLSINGQLYVEDLLSKNTHYSNNDLNNKLINETKNILHKHPKAEKLFNTALDKYSQGIYERNLLDDMRLALELFLKSVLSNNKSLENQKSAIGKFQKEKNASPELSNIFIKLVDCYAQYHNSNIKHNDNVKKNEIGFLINLTSSLIMYFN